MAILDVQDIHTYYGDAYVLQGLSLQLEQGQILGLLGPLFDLGQQRVDLLEHLCCRLRRVVAPLRARRHRLLC